MRDLETNLNDQRISNITRMGVIEQVNYSSPPKARVRIGEFLTGWMRMGAPRAGGDKDWAVYEPGEEVLVISTSGDFRHGVIACALNNGTNPGNANTANIRRTDYGNGSWIEHDRVTGNLTVNVTGDINLIAGGNVKINGKRIDLN